MKHSFLLAAAIGFTCNASFAGTSGKDLAASADELEKQVESDTTTGKLNKIDSDELEHRAKEIKRTVEEYTGDLAGNTVWNIQQKLNKLKKEIANKEKQTADAASSPAQ